MVKLYNRFSGKGDHQSKQETNGQQNESDQNNNQQSSHWCHPCNCHPCNCHPCKWLKKKIITGWKSLKNLDLEENLEKNFEEIFEEIVYSSFCYSCPCG